MKKETKKEKEKLERAGFVGFAFGVIVTTLIFTLLDIAIMK